VEKPLGIDNQHGLLTGRMW